jgi:hypothetical protein
MTDRAEKETDRAEKETVEFVYVKKGDEVLEVHPDTVSSHVQAGYEVIEQPTAEDKKAAKVTQEKAEADAKAASEQAEAAAEKEAGATATAKPAEVKAPLKR